MWGLTGATAGADQATSSFAFLFHNPSPFSVVTFSPSAVTGDTTQCPHVGVQVGPNLGAQDVIFYTPPGNPCDFTCVSTTAQCGNVHQQCEQYMFRVPSLPDSICVAGVEGAGNPFAGCFGNPDMCIVFSQGGDPSEPYFTVCPPGGTVYLDANCNYTLPDFWMTAVAMDSTDSVLTMTQTPTSGTTVSGPQFVNVSLIATDAAFNSATCLIGLSVVDTIPGTISCPANILTGNDLGFCHAVLNYSLPTVNDNCTGYTPTLVSGMNSGGTFPVGTSTVTWQSSTGLGHNDTCSFTVTVNDTESPSISCPQNITVPADSGACTAIVNYGSVLGTDNCAGAVTTQPGGLPSGSAFPSGVTFNSFVVTDAAGNNNTCTFSVTVNLSALAVSPTVNNTPCAFQLACNGDTNGVVTAVATGGCPPYSYAWSNGQTTATASGLSAGVWTATVTDMQGTTQILTATIQAPPILAATTSGVSDVCAGDSTGTVDLSVTGGHACSPYTFAWSNGATTEDLMNVPAGTYTVTVTDIMGCTATASWTIGAVAPMP
ncbi:MAG: HYR domain-containing protein, partial [Bacteroidota bacterium]